MSADRGAARHSTDEALFRASTVGDGQAFSELYERHARAIRKLLPWLYGIATNVLRNVLNADGTGLRNLTRDGAFDSGPAGLPTG